MIPQNRRLIYLFCIPVGLVIIAVVFFTDQQDSAVARYGYPMLFCYLVGALLVMALRPSKLAMVERVTFWAVTVFQVAAMGFRLFEAPDPAKAWLDLSPSSFMGMVILMVMAYLWYDTKLALVNSLFLVVVTGILGLAYFTRYADSYPRELFDFVRYEIYLIIVGIFVYSLARSKDRLLKSELEAARMKNLAYRDALTSLANRRNLVELLEALYRDESPVGVIMFDLDFFKAVNDTHGHQIGDQVLIEVAQIIEVATADGEQPGRWGGEEFLVVVQGSPARARELAEHLRSAIAERQFDSGIRLTASFGVAHSESSQTLNQLLTQSDIELYRAKSAGRNAVSAAFR